MEHTICVKTKDMKRTYNVINTHRTENVEEYTHTFNRTQKRNNLERMRSRRRRRAAAVYPPPYRGVPSKKQPSSAPKTPPKFHEAPPPLPRTRRKARGPRRSKRCSHELLLLLLLRTASICHACVHQRTLRFGCPRQRAGSAFRVRRRGRAAPTPPFSWVVSHPGAGSTTASRSALGRPPPCRRCRGGAGRNKTPAVEPESTTSAYSSI